MGSLLTRALNGIEGWVASKKVNADRVVEFAKYTVAPDSDYDSSSTGSRFDHSAWDAAMKTHVSAGTVDGVTTNVVDYTAIASDANFETYQSALAQADVESMKATPNDLLVLYINAYNCLCIGHVTRHLKEKGELPKSVTDTSPVKGTEIWDYEAGIVGGQTVSLNDIEHKILRSLWDEPRVHASIVCASASCPNLRAEAFVPERINEQMNDQTRTWVSDATKGVKVDDGEGEQLFSRIFLWFKGDFDGAGGPIAWVRTYLQEETENKLDADKEMKYFAYNWNLNKK